MQKLAQMCRAAIRHGFDARLAPERDLVLVGRLLGVQSIRGRCPRLCGTTSVRELSRCRRRSLRQVRQRICESTFLAAEEIDVLAENMEAVTNEQDRLAALAQNSGEDEKKWAQIANRMQA